MTEDKLKKTVIEAIREVVPLRAKKPICAICQVGMSYTETHYERVWTEESVRQGKCWDDTHIKTKVWDEHREMICVPCVEKSEYDKGEK